MAELTLAVAPWRLIDKLVLLAALAIAIGLFLSVGWMAIEPADPQGPVSLIAHRNGVLMAVQTTALAAVTAAIATIMIGTKLADVGVFAAALGMAVVSVRGATASYLLLNATAANRPPESALAGRLLIEGAIWSVVLFATVVVSAAVMRWFLNLGRGNWFGEAAPGAPKPVELKDLALSESPLLSSWLSVSAAPSKKMSLAETLVAGAGGASDVIGTILHWISHRRPPAATGRPRTGSDAIEYAPGILGFFMTLLCAGVLYPVMASGYLLRAVEHGQVCFAVFTAFYVGVWITKRSFPARTAFWPLLAVPVLLLGGYLWVWVAGTSASVRAGGIPHSDYLRALPLTFISVGALGVLVAHWSIEPSVPAPVEAPTPKRPVRRGRPGS